jgi:hypothetical protein
MSERDYSLHVKHVSITWTQAHSACGALNRYFRFTKIDVYPTLAEPGCGEVGIELYSLIDQGCAIFEAAADNDCKTKTGRAESDGVVFAQLRRPSGQPLCFGDLVRAFSHPTM